MVYHILWVTTNILRSIYMYEILIRCALLCKYVTEAKKTHIPLLSPAMLTKLALFQVLDCIAARLGQPLMLDTLRSLRFLDLQLSFKEHT